MDNPVVAGNSSGHPEEAFHATPSDPSRRRPSPLNSPYNPDQRTAPLRRGSPGTIRSLDPSALGRARCRTRQRQGDSGASRTTGAPSHHARRLGKAAGQRSGRVFGTHRSLGSLQRCRDPRIAPPARGAATPELTPTVPRPAGTAREQDSQAARLGARRTVDVYGKCSRALLADPVRVFHRWVQRANMAMK
jgi:hypothetical protein